LLEENKVLGLQNPYEDRQRSVASVREVIETKEVALERQLVNVLFNVSAVVFRQIRPLKMLFRSEDSLLND